MRRKPHERIFEIGSALLNYAKRWRKTRCEYVLNLLTSVSQRNGRIVRREQLYNLCNRSL